MTTFAKNDHDAAWLHLASMLMPMATPVGRMLLFLSIAFSGLAAAMWIYDRDPLQDAMALLSCGRHLGILHKTEDWLLVGRMDGTDKAGLTAFCDAQLTVSHQYAAALTTQSLSILALGLIWFLTDYGFLAIRYKSPFLNKTAVAAAPKAVKYEESEEAPTSTRFQHAMTRYRQRVKLREEQSRESMWSPFIKLFMLVSSAFLYTTINVVFTFKFWSSPYLSANTKLLIPVFMNVAIMIGCDLNLPAYLVYAWKRYVGVGAKARKELGVKGDDDVVPAMNSDGWAQYTSLLIACHNSACDEFERSQLKRSITAALVHLPAHHIFVCDNSSTDAPPDETQAFVKSIHKDINYLYIPIGNKSFAFYWTEKYWLPHLQKHGVVPAQANEFILIMDDDTPLPPNFAIPLERLRKEPDIAAVQYTVTASDERLHKEKGKPLLVGVQDIEYMPLNMIPEWAAPVTDDRGQQTPFLSWCMPYFCSGAVALWRQPDFRRVIGNHNSDFHGEDLQMGLLLLQERGTKRIVACDDREIVIPTVAPATFQELSRQRIQSWDVIAASWGLAIFVKQYLHAAYFGVVKGHKRSLKSAPLFLKWTLRTLWGYSYSLTGVQLAVYAWFFGYRDGAAHVLIPILIISILAQYLQPLMCYAHAIEFIPKWRRPTVAEILLWPWFLMYSSMLASMAVIYHFVVYSHRKLPPTIKSREQLGDIPPCPETVDPNWATIWKQ